MPDVTQLLLAIERGDPRAARELLPLVYDELRSLAAQRLAREKPGQTLQATALVHEAYVRLVASGGRKPPDSNQDSAEQNQGAHAPRSPAWNHRGHFFGAAAEAMRRILVEQARRKGRVRHGGLRQRVALDEACSLIEPPPLDDLLALDDALEKLAALDPKRAELVKLRFFAGLSMPDAAEALGVSLATAERSWTFARTWLFAELSAEAKKDEGA